MHRGVTTAVIALRQCPEGCHRLLAGIWSIALHCPMDSSTSNLLLFVPGMATVGSWVSGLCCSCCRCREISTHSLPTSSGLKVHRCVRQMSCCAYRKTQNTCMASHRVVGFAALDIPGWELEPFSSKIHEWGTLLRKHS